MVNQWAVCCISVKRLILHESCKKLWFYNIIISERKQITWLCKLNIPCTSLSMFLCLWGTSTNTLIKWFINPIYCTLIVYHITVQVKVRDSIIKLLLKGYYAISSSSSNNLCLKKLFYSYLPWTKLHTKTFAEFVCSKFQ